MFESKIERVVGMAKAEPRSRAWRSFKVAGHCALLAAASLLMSKASSATEDNRAVFSAATCQPYFTYTNVQYLSAYLFNTSSTGKLGVLCPVTRIVPQRAGNILAEVWVNRSSATASAVSCTFTSISEYGDEVDYFTRSSTTTGRQSLQLFTVGPAGGSGINMTDAKGESLNIRCTLPASSSLFSYETYGG